MVRPVMELAGFSRIQLEPGETKRVTFLLHQSQTAFLDEDMDWLIEKGKIRLMIGSSSQDIRLEGAYTITDSRKITGKDRAFWAKAKEASVTRGDFNPGLAWHFKKQNNR